jgi:hypothetical protein
VAQREGFKMLWAKSHKRPVSQAPSLSDSTLDQIVSSIIVEREQIGPNRYIANLGILFDRARAGQLLGIPGVRDRSQPMLLIPITVTGGTATSLELRNPVAAGLGAVPHIAKPDRLCPGQRPWGRSTARQCRAIRPARPRLVAQYPRPLRSSRHPRCRGNGCTGSIPAAQRRARFIGRHGPDGEIIGGFELTAPNSAEIPRMMDEGARRMDQLFAQAFAAGP